MKMVICGNYDCLYCDGQYKCQKDVISVGEEYSYGCDDYMSYLDTDEYKAKFYKAILTKDSKTAKVVDYGKRIEFNGRVFYTKDQVTEGDESYRLTDERTGLFVSTMAYLSDNYEKFLEREKEYPDVESLPLAKQTLNRYVLDKEVSK